MNDLTEFKRMNFFTGFFTTAEDWEKGQKYHLEKRRLHNQGLHTPGIIRGVGSELKVEASGGLNVRVLPGAALDGSGNEICLAQKSILKIDLPDSLPHVVYIAIRYHEELADYVEIPETTESPKYYGYTRMAEIPILEVTTTIPDNRTKVELARITLQAGVTAISNPVDPDNPGTNEIDCRFVVWAGSVGVAESSLSPDTLEMIILIMQDGRRDFAALASRYPVPSADDARHAVLTVEIMARTGGLRIEQVPNVLASIAAIEQDVGQEIGAVYPAVAATQQFRDYQEAVDVLLSSLHAGEGPDILLTRQGAVSEAARKLSEVIIQPPVANAGPDQSVTITGDEATVKLDAGNSQVFGGRKIKSYQWSHPEG